MNIKTVIKPFGVLRYLDDLGRVCLPMHMRKQLNYDKRQPVDICVDTEGNIVLRKI